MLCPDHFQDELWPSHYLLPLDLELLGDSSVWHAICSKTEIKLMSIDTSVSLYL